MREALGVTKVEIVYTNVRGKTRRYKYWKARILVGNGRYRALGHHKTKRAARAAYKAARLEMNALEQQSA